MGAIPEAVAIEARAKITWGEPPASVMAYLLGKGVGDTDARELLESLMDERARDIRSEGLKKLWTGLLMTLAPIGYYVGSRSVGYISLKLLAGLGVVGIVGLWRSIDGMFKVARPRTESGDISNGREI